MSASPAQLKNFFAALCYANGLTSVFEKQLVNVPRRDLPNVLLSSIIFENCGLAKIKEYIPLVVACKEAEYWVDIPNQYILQDRTWLYPVIRACDPARLTFTEKVYGDRIMVDIERCLGIKLSTRGGDKVQVEMRRGLQNIVQIASQPSLVDMSQKELREVLTLALTEELFCSIKSFPGKSIFATNEMPEYASESLWESRSMNLSPITSNERGDDMSRGLQLLVFLFASFVSTCLLVGFYFAA